MEVDGVSGDVVKAGTKRTHSGELAHFSSPHPPTTPTSSFSQDNSSAGNLLGLIAKVFRVTFSVSSS